MTPKSGFRRIETLLQPRWTWVFSGLMLFLAGGCRPEFTNAVVDAFETGVRGVVDAALDIYFEEVRPNSIR